MLELMTFIVPTLLIGVIIYWATRKVVNTISVMLFSLGLFVFQYFLVFKYSIPYLSDLLGSYVNYTLPQSMNNEYIGLSLFILTPLAAYLAIFLVYFIAVGIKKRYALGISLICTITFIIDFLAAIAG